MLEISVIKLNAENFIHLDIIDFTQYEHKKSKKRCFWPSLLCYYEKIMKRRCIKFSVFSYIAENSNILQEEINALCISTLTRKTTDYTINAYAIPTYQ